MCVCDNYSCVGCWEMACWESRPSGRGKGREGWDSGCKDEEGLREGGGWLELGVRNHNTASVIDPDTHTTSEVNPIKTRHTNIRSRAACISAMMSGRSGVVN